MMIKFTRDADALREGGDYKLGRVVDLPEASARHWLNRQAAVQHVEPRQEAKADKQDRADVRVK